MAITTEVKIIKTLTCDGCGWICDNSECCPMEGKITSKDVQDKHPEFLWVDGQTFCEECSESRVCQGKDYECESKSAQELRFCSACDLYLCDKCAEECEKDHPEHI